MRTSRLALIIVVVLAIAQLVALAFMLPDTVASHFGLGGQPDSFMRRSEFIVVMALVEGLGLSAAIIGPVIVAQAPPELVNLPNKDYWLAPQNKARAIARFGSYMDWFAAALGALFLFVNALVLRANLRQAPLEEAVFLVGLGAFIAFAIGWSILLFRAFRVPADAQRGR